MYRTAGEIIAGTLFIFPGLVTLWFALHNLFDDISEARVDRLRLLMPEWATIQWLAHGLALRTLG